MAMPTEMTPTIAKVMKKTPMMEQVDILHFFFLPVA